MAEYFPASFRLFAFVSFPIATLALWGCLRSLARLTRVESLAIIWLFMLSPTNSARFSMTIFRYTSANMFFFVACYLYLRKQSVLSRVIALCLFFLSFDTASFFVFMLVPLGLSMLEHYDRGVPPSRWVKKNLDFIFIGPAVWFIEPLLNPTTDLVRDAYYTPNIAGVTRGLVISGLLMILTTFAFRIRKWRYDSHRGGIQLLVGLILCWLGIFPYMAIGHFPNLYSLLIGFVPGASDWDSRHQLLLPLGLALAIVGIINLLNVSKVRRAALSVATFFSILNLSFAQEYYLDSIKTARVIEAFRSDEKIRELRFALIDDLTSRFNARGRTIRSYEWDAMLRAANPDLKQRSDALRFVDCNSIKPDSVITIQAQNGKLETLLTRDPGIAISVEMIQPCS